MGHSMGGLALMEFTKRYPQMQKYVDRVIIVDISPSKINGDPKWENTKKMLSKMDSIPLNQTP
jgi:pimeloyl-ACP methyl ester carboxylesterase